MNCLVIIFKAAWLSPEATVADLRGAGKCWFGFDAFEGRNSRYPPGAFSIFLLLILLLFPFLLRRLQRCRFGSDSAFET
jgi:hypothetical protein